MSANNFAEDIPNFRYKRSSPTSNCKTSTIKANTVSDEQLFQVQAILAFRVCFDPKFPMENLAKHRTSTFFQLLVAFDCLNLFGN